MIEIIGIIISWEIGKWAFDKLWNYGKDKATIKIVGKNLKVKLDKFEKEFDK